MYFAKLQFSRELLKLSSEFPSPEFFSTPKAPHSLCLLWYLDRRLDADLHFSNRRLRNGWKKQLSQVSESDRRSIVEKPVIDGLKSTFNDQERRSFDSPNEKLDKATSIRIILLPRSQAALNQPAIYLSL
jgi:hypothetical protein